MLELPDLERLSELLDSDTILINTPEGIKEILASQIGAAISPTTLYERFTKSISTVLNAEKISSSNQILRYLKRNTDDEIYMELDKDSAVWYRASVVKAAGKPQTQQAVDMSGKLLYWSDSIELCEYSEDGYPWKTPKGKKIYITYTNTGYPITVYKYQRAVIKSSIIDEEIGLQNKYYFGLSQQYGNISKSSTDFRFSMLLSGKECGIQVTVNTTTGEMLGKFIGTWEGINDVPGEQKLTTLNAKEFLYMSQDLTIYIPSIMVNTSNKVGWYLMSDTSNKTYFFMKDGTMSVYLAVVKTNPSTGLPITSTVHNIYGKQLYWRQNMTNSGSISEYGYPLNHGLPVFMTTDVTSYPVYMYEYNIIELMKFSYSTSKGVEQKFSDSSSNAGSLYISNGLHIDYTKTGSTSPSTQIVLGDTGTIAGSWNVSGSHSGTLMGIPVIPSTMKTPVLTGSGGNIVWTENYGGTYSSISGSSPSITMIHNHTFILTNSSSLSITVSPPSDLTSGRMVACKIFVPTTVSSVSWSSNIIATASEKAPNTSGTTEYMLTYYQGYNGTNIYLKKL